MKDRILTQVAGISGMGKSYLVKQKLIPTLSKFQPVIIFDKMREYAGQYAKDVPGNWKNHQSIFSFLGNLEKNPELTGVHVIQCKNISDYDTGIRFFDSLGAGVALVLDEAHFIFDEPELKKLANTIKNLARFGRHKKISLVLVSQRILDVPPDVRSQFTGLISFKQSEKADVDSLNSRGWEGVKKILDFKPREFEIFGEIPTEIKTALNKN